ncbi:DNA polymerase alpha catalytic subunit [Tyrophagus putrescentiae]|nr:DNA polymerase alpha catalytic subunit [Tyrophagus putrescentiae]
MDDVEIDTEAIDSLVEATLKPKPREFSTPQALRLKKRGLTPTQPLTSYGSAQSALKRKSFMAPGSTGSPRNIFATGLPPMKKRVLEYNFDDIIDEEEVKKEVGLNDSLSRKTMTPTNGSKTSSKPTASSAVKEEPMDDGGLDEDYLLPDNSAYDDIDFDALVAATEKKPDTEALKKSAQLLGATTSKSTAQRSLLEEEEWELAFATDEEGNKLLDFFWFDAFTDQSRNTDAVYLFGKVWVEAIKKYASASVCVKNVERSVFLLPRERLLDDKTRRVTLNDVYEEFRDRVAPRLKIAEFRSRRVVKRYAFELANIPAEAEYLEVKYSGTYQPLPPAYHTGNTYRHVFGAGASILERLILTLGLSGPGWLVLKNATLTEAPVTWCKIELAVNGQSQISVEGGAGSATDTPLKPPRPSPDFTLLSLNFKTFANPETRQNEIVAISCLANRSFKFEQSSTSSSSNQALKHDPTSTPAKYDSHFCMITRPSAKAGIQLPIDFTPKMALKEYRKTTLSVHSSERELLNCFLAKFHQLDADIIVGHDVFAFDYDLLLSRFAHFKVQNLWSKLGRIRRTGLPIRTKDKHLLAGRLVCDVKILARELIRAKSYDLTELAATILKKGRFELLRLVDLMMRDNELTLGIMYELNCLPLVKQITNIAGNLLSRTLLGGRAERNEYLLLHAFHEKGYIVPDKVVRFGKDLKGGGGGASKSAAPVSEAIEEAEAEDDGEEGGSGGGKKKGKAVAKPSSTSYVGGLVLEPKVGFYDKFILLMDFNSLYPSIIQEYNICFTTVKVNHLVEQGDLEQSSPEAIAHLLDDHQNGDGKEGILPTEIRKLVESRREVKRALLDPSLSPEERLQLDIKQKALKITANSMYGCLGFAASRFYAKHLAALITYKGREILTATKELVERIGYEVIYGDTDSIMILTSALKYEEVRETGRRIQAEVNRKYKLLEIDIDGVFRCMLLLKKKKYAALTVVNSGPKNGNQTTFQREIKGLDIVRRDWSMLAKVAGEAVLELILVPDKPVRSIVDDIHVYLKGLADEVRAGQRPLEDFVINKALTKRPEEYGDGAKGLTHVTVALRYNALNLGKALRAGDTVPYIVCLDGTSAAATQRGYHIDEPRPPTLTIDTHYYLAQQLLPVVSRLCEPLDGTDSTIIAEFLGVETAAVRRSAAAAVQLELDPALNAGEHKYDACRGVVLRCLPAPLGCGQPFEFRDLFPVWAKYRSAKKSDDPNKKKSIYEEMAEEADLFKTALDGCDRCGVRFSAASRSLAAAVRDLVGRFYRRELLCDDPACSYVTRYASGRMVQGRGNRLACGRCKHGTLHLEMSEHLLFQQLNFFVHIFDLDAALSRFTVLELSPEQKAERKLFESTYRPFFAALRQTVQAYLDQSSYNEFDLGVLFRKFRYGGSSQQQQQSSGSSGGGGVIKKA